MSPLAVTGENIPFIPWGLLMLVVALYLVAVASLIAAGRREDARALAGFIPDCIVLVSRLARDRRISRPRRVALFVVLGYLALPIDLVFREHGRAIVGGVVDHEAIRIVRVERQSEEPLFVLPPDEIVYVEDHRLLARRQVESGHDPSLLDHEQPVVARTGCGQHRLVKGLRHELHVDLELRKRWRPGSWSSS